MAFQLQRTGRLLLLRGAAQSPSACRGGILSPRRSCGGILSPRRSCGGILSPRRSCGGILSPRRSCGGILSPSATGVGILSPSATGVGILSPSATGVGILSPSATGVGVLSPSASCGRILSPSASCGRILSPSARCGGILSPSARCAGILSPSARCGGILSPSARCAGILSPSARCGGILSPSARCGGILSPSSRCGGILSPSASCGGVLSPRRSCGGIPPGTRKRVLLDMDGVIADFEGGFLKKYRQRYPNDPYISLEERRGFWVSIQYGELREDLCDKAISIWESKNFFMELEPLPGSVEAVRDMAKLKNTDVFICTSPIKHYAHCPYEKYAWVDRHLGPDFLEKVILTRDKTIVSGDILIDDKPDILGIEPNPSWEHVLFTACHNKHLPASTTQRRLHSWADDWRGILESKR